MIRIPRPIEYDELHHLRDIITKPLDTESKKDLEFIRHVLTDLKKVGAETYIVRLDTGKVRICRKGLKPAITKHKERNCFYALRNRAGKVIVNGKNSRRPESVISVLKAMFRRNSVKLTKLSHSNHLNTADRCKLFNYDLLKQDLPFN